MNKFYTAIVLISAFSISLAFMERGPEFSKTIKKEFSLKEGGLVDITNKYGNIDIEPWDQSGVSFEVTITVEAKNKEKAAEKLKNYSVEFSSAGGNVKAETDFDSESGFSIWNGETGSDLKSVHYKVKIPCTANLELENKYGNINLPTLEGEANVMLKYGNLKSGQIAGKLDLELKYGNADLSVVGGLDAEVGYATIRGNDVGNFNMESKYSKFFLDKAQTLNVESKYDKFEIEEVKKLNYDGKYTDIYIGKVGGVNFDARYSDFKFDELNGDLNGELSYGDLIVGGFGNDFHKLDLDGSYSDAVYHIGSTSCTIDLSGSYTSISYPEGATTKNSNKSNSEHSVKATYGNNPNGKVIKTRASYGSIKVK